MKKKGKRGSRKGKRREGRGNGREKGHEGMEKGKGKLEREGKKPHKKGGTFEVELFGAPKRSIILQKYKSHMKSVAVLSCASIF